MINSFGPSAGRVSRRRGYESLIFPKLLGLIAWLRESMSRRNSSRRRAASQKVEVSPPFSSLAATIWVTLSTVTRHVAGLPTRKAPAFLLQALFIFVRQSARPRTFPAIQCVGFLDASSNGSESGPTWQTARSRCSYGHG